MENKKTNEMREALAAAKKVWELSGLPTKGLKEITEKYYDTHPKGYRSGEFEYYVSI